VAGLAHPFWIKKGHFRKLFIFSPLRKTIL